MRLNYKDNYSFDSGAIPGFFYLILNMLKLKNGTGPS